jgi:transposase
MQLLESATGKKPRKRWRDFWSLLAFLDEGSMKQAELTDEQWAVIEPLIAKSLARPNRRGRPVRDPCEVLSGIFWLLRYNARWQDLPEHFPSSQTCNRRFQQWKRDGTLRAVLEALEKDLRERGGFEVTEWLTDYRARASKEDEQEDNRANRTSWQQWTAMLFLSRSMQLLLYRLKSPLAQKLSHRFTPPGGPGVLVPLALFGVCQLVGAGAETSVFEALLG